MSAQQEEKKDNSNYAKHFTRNPNILYDSYKHLTKEEKWLHSCLRRIFCEDAKPRYYSLRELSSLTDYSVGALSKMLPRLHKVGLIHAEVKKKKTRDGRETGNALYHITIIDIWELNRDFYSCSPNERVDPSDVLVHEMIQACSRNDTSLSHLVNNPVSFGEQDRAQNDPQKRSLRSNQKKNTEKDTAHVSNDNAPTHSHSSLQEPTTPESEETAPPSEQSTKQASAVSDSQKGTANDAQPIASTSKTEQQQSAPTIEQPALIERPAKPVMPPASMKWCAEKMVQVTEAKRGRYYTDKQRPAQLKAARKILAEEITEEQYCASYDDRNNKWWREHNGLLDVTHMAAIPSGQVEMRVVTIWHKIESRIALLEQENSTFNDQKDNMSRKNMVETGSRVPVPQRLTREQLKATEQEAV